MPVDFTILSLLAAPIVREVFTQVAKSRLIRFGDLLKATGHEASESERQQVRRVLQQLKDASLVKETSSPVEDFATYYVTADGLEASRRAEVEGA